MSNQIQELADKIIEAKKAYYNDNDPIMSDDDYDLLEDQLRELDPNNRALQLTGIDIKERSNWTKKNLFVRMGSLDKVKSVEEFNIWFNTFKNKQDFWFNPKGDGISIQLHYNKGKLISAITRGNGFQGEDILSNVMKMKNVYLGEIPLYENVVLKGEIILKIDDFEKIKDQGYSNPRNAASGIAKSIDGFNCQFLTILYYGAHVNDEEIKPSLLKNFLDTLNVDSIGVFEISSLEESYSKLINNRNFYGFEIDGFVIKQDSKAIYNNNCPQNQIALKFPAQKAIAKIKNLRFQQGRTGKLTPVVDFENPFYLSGALISKCNMASWDLVLEKKTFPGSIVEVIRSNDVIPYINCCVDSSNSSPIDIDDVREQLNNNDIYHEGKNLFIPPNGSRISIVNEIFHIFKVLEIKNASKKSVEDIVDFFELKKSYEIFDCDFNKLLTKSGWGNGKVQMINQQFKEKSTVDLKQIVLMLNIPNLGSRRVTEIFNALEIKSLNQLLNLKIEDYLQVPTVKERLAELIFNGIQNKKETAIELKKRLEVEKKTEVTSEKLKDLGFTITGKTSKPRKDLEKLIESLGGKNASINKANYLITNDAGTNSSKNKKASELGVQIISEKEFQDLFSITY